MRRALLKNFNDTEVVELRYFSSSKIMGMFTLF